MPDVLMPQLGESVTEGVIGKWLKSVGETVTKYEPIAEVITDKVTAEIPSDFDGVMEAISVAEGETVKIGTVICKIATEAGTAGTPTPPTAALTHVSKEAEERKPSASTNDAAPRVDAERHRSRYSPAVLRLAAEHDIDLALLSGTGEGGRITRKDVLAYVAASPSQEATKAPLTTVAAAAAVPTGGGAVRSDEVSVPNKGAAFAGQSTVDGETWIEPSPIRKTIAHKMVESKRNAPHAWTMVEADVSRLVNYRSHIKTEFKRREGIDLTYLPFFIKAVAEGLKQFPMVNASWVDDKIVLKKQINISIAVSTDDALVVPVIHDADRLSIAGLAHAVNGLAAKARSGRLAMTDVQGGTFTVNNTGAFGSILSQPILNAPQAAILSVESIVKRPVVVEGDAIAVRSVVNLCLSLDHRLLDGWIAGSFLKAVRQRLETFDDQTAIY